MRSTVLLSREIEERMKLRQYDSFGIDSARFYSLLQCWKHI